MNQNKPYKIHFLLALAIIIIAGLSINGFQNHQVNFASASVKDSLAQKAKVPSEWQESTNGLREAFIAGLPANILAEVEAAKNEDLAAKFPVTLPVRFHLISAEVDGEIMGDVDDSVIQEQIDILNENFAGDAGSGNHSDTGFQFNLASVDRLTLEEDDPNYDWFTNCYQDYTAIANSLVIDPANSINIITCAMTSSVDGNPLLGFATPPWKYSASDKTNSIFIHYQTLPGQGTDWLAYYEGDNATHEMGHYLGLIHTFGANQSTCTLTGSDYINDTPAEKSASTGGSCPSNKDSCPNQPGYDPVSNFMDYTYNNCMEEFSSDQTDRMQMMTSLYRPGLIIQ